MYFRYFVYDFILNKKIRALASFCMEWMAASLAKGRKRRA